MADKVQSRTYNNGRYLEYIYTLTPKNGKAQSTSVFIDVLNGQQINPKSVALYLDYGSENKFKGTCCEIYPDICENAWVTEQINPWVTEDGSCWSIA